MAALDLSDIPVVDNHCHAVEARQGHVDVAAWRALFTESPDPGMRVHAADTPFYRRLMRAMAAFHGLDTGGAGDSADADEPAEQAVLQARAAWSTTDLVGALFREAAIGAVVVDTGFPAAETALPEPALTAATGVQQASLLRLELLFQDLVAAHARYDDLLEALDARLSDSRAKGFAGYKSIAGYRTGLDLARWPADDARAAFARARGEVSDTGSVRLGHKPLLDTLLHRALGSAAEQQLPVQFHVGYGDPDVDLRTASPLALRPVLEEPAYRDVPVVLLHGCWPYVREGAFLAAVYGNAHLDLSYAIPFLSVAEMTSMTRAALGAAPAGKLLYSSDGVRVPELHWLGARYGRQVLATCLAELVRDGDLPAARAEGVAVRVLADNARALYGLA